MARLWLLFCAIPALRFLAPRCGRAPRARVLRRAVVSQTVPEDTIVLPKSHLHGALQRVLGRDVYKSETPFFSRTTEKGDFYYALVRTPALPQKKLDGSNYIPARPFHYNLGRGATLEEAEQEAARAALQVIRRADSELARGLSWRATTSKQALEVAAAQIADARPTDGEARQRLNRALAIIHQKTIKKHELRYFTRDDPESCHVVLRVPWKGGRMYYFEGSGLTSVLARESAAEAALRIVGPMARGMETSKLPWRAPRQRPRPTGPRGPSSLKDAALNQKVEAKIRLFQLLENVMRRSGRSFSRKDVDYSCRPVVEDEDAEVWESNVTEITVRLPPLQPQGEELSFSLRVPSWKKPKLPEHLGKNGANRKRFYKLKAESRRFFLEAQQKVAALAVDEIVKLLPEELLKDNSEDEPQEADEAVQASLDKAARVLDAAKVLLTEDNGEP